MLFSAAAARIIVALTSSLLGTVSDLAAIPKSWIIASSLVGAIASSTQLFPSAA